MYLVLAIAWTQSVGTSTTYRGFIRSAKLSHRHATTYTNHDATPSVLPFHALVECRCVMVIDTFGVCICFGDNTPKCASNKLVGQQCITVLGSRDELGRENRHARKGEICHVHNTQQLMKKRQQHINNYCTLRETYDN